MKKWSTKICFGFLSCRGNTGKRCTFFFSEIIDDKPNLSYTKGKGADLRRLRKNPERMESLPNRTDAQHTRMNFLETSH